MSIGLIIFACLGTGVVMSLVTLKFFLEAMTKEQVASVLLDEQGYAEQAARAHPNLDPSFVDTP